MKVSIIKQCSYSPDKVNSRVLYVGDVVDVPDHIGKAFIGHGYCVQEKDSIEKVNNFSPVEETAVVSPVEEVKKTRRKRKKKGE